MYKVLTLPSGKVIPTAIDAVTGEGPVKVAYPEGWTLEDNSCPLNKADND